MAKQEEKEVVREAQRLLAIDNIDPTRQVRIYLEDHLGDWHREQYDNFASCISEIGTKQLDAEQLDAEALGYAPPTNNDVIDGFARSVSNWHRFRVEQQAYHKLVISPERVEVTDWLPHPNYRYTEGETIYISNDEAAMARLTAIICDDLQLAGCGASEAIVEALDNVFGECWFLSVFEDGDAVATNGLTADTNTELAELYNFDLCKSWELSFSSSDKACAEQVDLVIRWIIEGEGTTND